MNKGKIALILLIIVILLGFFLWKSSQEKIDEGAYIPETPEINGTTTTAENTNLDELNTAVKDLESLLQTQKSEKDLDDSNVGIQ